MVPKGVKSHIWRLLCLQRSFIAARISPIFVPLGVALLCEEGLLSSNRRRREEVSSNFLFIIIIKVFRSKCRPFDGRGRTTVGPSCSPVHHSSVAAWKNMIHHLVPSDRRRSGDRSEGNFGEEKSGPTHSNEGRATKSPSHDQPLF